MSRTRREGVQGLVSSGEKRTLVAVVKRAVVLVGAWFAHGRWWVGGIIRIAMIMFDGSRTAAYTAPAGSP